MRRKVLKTAVCIFTSLALVLGTFGSTPFTRKAEAKTVETKSNKSVKRNVLYYGDWSIWGGQGNFYPKDIAAKEITHLNFSFMDFDSNGDLKFTDTDAAVSATVGMPVEWAGPNAGLLNALQDLRAQNPNLKIGVSVGGWSKSGDFSRVAADPGKRANLVNNLMKFIKYTNMDFVDIDWEYPADVRQPDLVDNKQDEGTPHATPEDKENYIILLQDLRSALDEQGVKLEKEYELSVAIPAPIAKLDKGIDVDRLFDTIDFGNIMSYDMRGAWDEVSGHQTGLYTNPKDPLKGKGFSVDEAVNYLLDEGAPADKIVIGSAFYSRGWEKVSKGPVAENPGLFGDAEVVNKDADQTPSRGANPELPLASGDGGRCTGIWSYRNIDKLKAAYPGLKEYWDDAAKAPYLYSESTGAFFTFENVRSITEKNEVCKRQRVRRYDQLDGRTGQAYYIFKT